MLSDRGVMSGKIFKGSPLVQRGDFDYTGLARRIGARLRDLYGNPEAEPVPAEQVQLLLTLRHKERDTRRS